MGLFGLYSLLSVPKGAVLRSETLLAECVGYRMVLPSRRKGSRSSQVHSRSSKQLPSLCGRSALLNLWCPQEFSAVSGLSAADAGIARRLLGPCPAVLSPRLGWPWHVSGRRRERGEAADPPALRRSWPALRRSWPAPGFPHLQRRLAHICQSMRVQRAAQMHYSCTRGHD